MPKFVKDMSLGKRTAAFILVLLCFSPSGHGELQEKKDSAERKIRIGLALPLSGDMVWLGENTLRGAQLYLKERPEFGARAELIVEDVSSRSLGQGVSSGRKLIEIDKVDVLLAEMSPIIKVLAPLSDEKKVPMMAVTADDSARGRTHVLRLFVPAENEAKAAQEYITAHGLYPVALLTAERESLITRSNALRRVLDRGKISLDQVLSGSQEISVMALRVAAQKPRAVILNLMPGDYGAAARRLRELQYGGAIICPPMVANEGDKRAGGAALRGAVYTGNLFAAEFIEAYRREYGAAPGLGSGNGYDALKLVDQAQRSLNYSWDGDSLNQALRVRNFRGALGDYSFSFDENNYYDLPAVVLTLD